VRVWCGQEKHEGRELKHGQPPPFAQSAGKRPLVIPREAGNEGVEKRRCRKAKVSKSWRARKSKDEGRAKQSMRKSKESSLGEGNWSKVGMLRRCGEEMVKRMKL
jgi:hypothetical protein